MDLAKIIRESEREHAAPCPLGEWRQAKLTPEEAKELSDTAIMRTMRGEWDASVCMTNGKRTLRYTKRK